MARAPVVRLATLLCAAAAAVGLAQAPAKEMQSLLARLVPGSQWSAEGIGANDNRHQLYGNRMRAADLSLAEVKEDAAWQRDMPRAYLSQVSVLTAPLRRRYGYA